MALRTPLLDVPIARLRDLLVSLGEPAYRASQLYRAVLRDGHTDAAAITTLPLAARARVGAAFSLAHGRVASRSAAADGTVKFLVELGAAGGGADAAAAAAAAAALGLAPKAAPRGGPRVVEAVLIPEARRATLCVSSQAGCSLACAFCATGTQAMRGNLGASEILAQVLIARADAAARGAPPPTNVVFMGQGEPLLNWRAVARAAAVLVDARDGLALPPRRVLVSTAGVAPVIPRVALDAPGVRLALSLHAPDDARRSAIMGINARFPLAEVMAACAQYVDIRLAAVARGAARAQAGAGRGDGGGGGGGGGDDDDADSDSDDGADDTSAAAASVRAPPGQRFNGTRRVRVSFEYILLRGVNDAPADARALAALLARWRPAARAHAHVNLIPFNAWEGAPFGAPARGVAGDFAAALRDEGFAATVRRARGADVAGACGQLRAGTERKRAAV